MRNVPSNFRLPSSGFAMHVSRLCAAPRTDIIASVPANDTVRGLIFGGCIPVSWRIEAAAHKGDRKDASIDRAAGDGDDDRRWPMPSPPIARAIRYKTVAWGLGLQIAFAFLVMRWDFGRRIFENWATEQNGFWISPITAPHSYLAISARKILRRGFYFAFQALPTIIFIAAFFAVLYYLGVMQLIVKAAARVMTSLMGASGAESLNVAASIFMGQTEAPLTIRPFLPEVTRSELMTIMTSGMAHVSGGMMAAYMAYGIEAKHLLAAVIMTAPGTILLAKILRAGNGKAADLRPRGNGGNRARRERPRRDFARNDRRFASGAERRRHADLLHRADLSGGRLLLRGSQLACSPRHGAGFLRASSRFSAGCFRRWPG